MQPIVLLPSIFVAWMTRISRIWENMRKASSLSSHVEPETCCSRPIRHGRPADVGAQSCGLSRLQSILRPNSCAKSQLRLRLRGYDILAEAHFAPLRDEQVTEPRGRL